MELCQELSLDKEIEIIIQEKSKLYTKGTLILNEGKMKQWAFQAGAKWMYQLLDEVAKQKELLDEKEQEDDNV